MSDEWPHLPGCPGDPKWLQKEPCFERCPVLLRSQLAALTAENAKLKADVEIYEGLNRQRAEVIDRLFLAEASIATLTAERDATLLVTRGQADALALDVKEIRGLRAERDRLKAALEACAAVIEQGERGAMKWCPSCGSPLEDCDATVVLPGSFEENPRSARWCAGRIARRALAAPPMPPTGLAALRTMTPAELAKFKPLTDEAIADALERGERDKYAAEHLAAPPTPAVQGEPPRCEPWCPGWCGSLQTRGCSHDGRSCHPPHDDNRLYCSLACRDAGKPTHPREGEPGSQGTPEGGKP